MGIEPTTFRILVGCSNHWATENSVVIRSILGWHNYRIAQSHVKWTHNINCIAQSRKYSFSLKVSGNFASKFLLLSPTQTFLWWISTVLRDSVIPPLHVLLRHVFLHFFRWGGLRDEPNMRGCKEESIYEMVACTQTLFCFSFRKSTFSTPNS